MFDYFDFKVVLNHPAAVERWRQTVSELERVGLKGYTRFEAFIDHPHRSFNRSIIGVIGEFVASGKKRMLFLEDDVIFKRNTELLKRHYLAAMVELPKDWEVLYLGCNLHVGGFQPPTRYSQHLCRVYNAWTTHAVAFSREAAIRILAEAPSIEKIGMFDGWLSDNLKDYRAYCVTPMLAMQRPGDSLIWGGKVNYDPIFIESNNILLNSK